VHSGVDILKLMQTRHVQLIVQRQGFQKPILWSKADQYFESSVDWKALKNLTYALGSGAQTPSSGFLYALKPVEVIPFQDFPVPVSQKARLTGEFEQKAKEIEKIDDEKERERAEKILAAYTGRLMLGVPLVDQKVIYNPGPWVLFEDTMRDVWRTLTGLFSGSLSPKWVAGPVGIIQMLHHSWGLGVSEALFWLAVISLNLGILNLLPIPPFDGGHIVISFIEGITGKRVNHKVMDRIVMVFVILLIGFALYITFNDVVRLVGTFF
ncbi:MAG TPA: site-2 protease family protein, partial [Chlamydiales bacterium]|nr:site-2 protease family protein [Chlamydiales bacterium]